MIMLVYAGLVLVKLVDQTTWLGLVKLVRMLKSSVENSVIIYTHPHFILNLFEFPSVAKHKILCFDCWFEYWFPCILAKIDTMNKNLKIAVKTEHLL